jgi:hypothetical protein
MSVCFFSDQVSEQDYTAAALADMTVVVGRSFEVYLSAELDD